MRSTKDASSACFTGPPLCARAAPIGNACVVSPGPWGGPISAGFGTVYGAKPLSPRGKSVLSTIGTNGGDERSASTQDEVLGERAELVKRRVEPARGITLERAGRGRPAPRGDAVIRGPPQHPQHVRTLRDEDRIGQMMVAQELADAGDRLTRRAAGVLDEDRRRGHSPGDRVGPGAGRLGRPVAVGLAAG